ncbi:MAG: NUDIX hydrolase [Flavobacteriales bacterium]|nr:NUDIX hydrolase [Flavobacteriales bacterium]
MKEQSIKVAVDAVVLGYKEEQLYLLLVKQRFGSFAGQWVIPGGFVLNGEGLSDAVRREVREETGIEVDYLEQLFTFGDDVARDPRGQVISVSYLALVNPEKFSLNPDTDAIGAEWFPLKEIPTLPFDHTLIVKKGWERLQAKLTYKPIGFDLLKTEFRFSDLEKLYQTILEQPLDRRNFRKKILSFGFVEETGGVSVDGSGRPGKLYRFNTAKYKMFEDKGFHFEIKFA